MTAGIKPPGGGPGPIDPLRGAQELEHAAPSEASATGQAEAGGGVERSSTAAWLERVDAGEISAEQAVDAIVAETLEAHGAQRLDAARRAELESLLRAALLEDPALSALVHGSDSP